MGLRCWFYCRHEGIRSSSLESWKLWWCIFCSIILGHIFSILEGWCKRIMDWNWIAYRKTPFGKIFIRSTMFENMWSYLIHGKRLREGSKKDERWRRNDYQRYYDVVLSRFYECNNWKKRGIRNNRSWCSNSSRIICKVLVKSWRSWK